VVLAGRPAAISENGIPDVLGPVVRLVLSLVAMGVSAFALLSPPGQGARQKPTDPGTKVFLMAIVLVIGGLIAAQAVVEMRRFLRFGRGGLRARRMYRVTFADDATVLLRPIAVDDRCLIRVRCDYRWARILRVAPGTPPPEFLAPKPADFENNLVGPLIQSFRSSQRQAGWARSTSSSVTGSVRYRARGLFGGSRP